MMRTVLHIAALMALGLGTAHAQFNQPAKATTGGGGESSGGGLRHFSATGLGMAVGRTSGGGITARHGFLVGAATSQSDDIPPEIDPPDDIVQSTDRDRCAGTVRIPPVDVSDNRDGNPEVTVTILDDPPIDVDPTGEDIELDVGSYDVIIEAEDRAGNTSRATFRIDVVDRAPPVFVQVPDPTPVGEEAEADSPAGTRVAFQGECRDACDPNPQISYNPAMARYPVGDTGIVATCTDANDNAIEAAFTIRVRDTTPPVLAAELQDAEVECDSPQGTEIDLPRVLFNDNGTPSEDLAISLVLNPGAAGERQLDPIPQSITLARGQHVLRYTATDASGNSESADLGIIVIDNGVPQLEILAAPDNGWANGDEPVQVILQITDGCSGEDAPLDIDVAPPPDQLDRDGDRVTLTYSGEGLYELQVAITDDDGNTTRDNSVAFGIDDTAPQAIIRIPRQIDVDVDEPDSYPIFARAETLPVDFGGEDAGDGATSGVRSVQVIYSPDDNPRVLAENVYEGDGNPQRGDRLVAGVGCERELGREVAGVPQRDRYCNVDTEFDIRHLDVGAHEVEVIVTDFAGNTGTGRGYFTSADLNAGVQRIIADIGGDVLPNLNGPAVGPTRAALAALARARDASDRRIDGTPYDSSQFLGTALRASQTATIQLLAAADVADNDQGQADALVEAVHLLQRVARSDAVLLAAYVDERQPPVRPRFKDDAESLDLEFFADFLELVDENLDNEEYNTAIVNTQNAYFHAKSALEGWVMDYHYVPNQAAPLEIRQEYVYANEILESMTEQMDTYVNEGLAGANEIGDIRASLVGVFGALDTLIESGFETNDNRDGLSDQRYVEELIELRAVANRSKLAGNNGVWVRNIQWSIMQIVRFMVHASIEDAILNRGQGRRGWPIYATGIDLIERGVDDLDERRIQTVIDLYGVNEDSICLLIASYHCDFLDDEDPDFDQTIPEEDVPNFCWSRMWRPSEWDDRAPIQGIPPRCQYGDQIER